VRKLKIAGKPAKNAETLIGNILNWMQWYFPCI
jgi:hypothetical protein